MECSCTAEYNIPRSGTGVLVNDPCPSSVECAAEKGWEGEVLLVCIFPLFYPVTQMCGFHIFLIHPLYCFPSPTACCADIVSCPQPFVADALAISFCTSPKDSHAEVFYISLEVSELVNANEEEHAFSKLRSVLSRLESRLYYESKYKRYERLI